jgi:hypothetical protein
LLDSKNASEYGPNRRHGLTALEYLQEIDPGQHTGGVQDKLDLQPLGKSITFQEF